MKRISYFLFALLFVATFSACGDESGDSTTEEATEEVSEIPETDGDGAEAMADGDQWVSLWGTGGIREDAGRKAKWITRVAFGERVTYLGEQQEVTDEDRTYVKIRLSDGKEGWMNEYLLAPDAEVAAFTKSSSIFRRPDFTTSTGDKFEMGEVVAVTQKDGEWWEVVGEQKKKKGWIQYKNNMAMDEIDIAVALMLDKSMNEGNPQKKADILNDIVNNTAFESSIFYAEAQSRLEEDIAEMPDLSDNQLMVTGDNVNVRLDPDTQADNKLFQLNYGDIVTIVQTGKKETIGGKTDYWYQIDGPDGQKGWIFGSFTSKAL